MQLLALAPEHGEPSEIPPPGPGDRPGPGPIAAQLGDDDLAGGQDEHLGDHSEQMEGAVALEDGEELVAPLQLLEGDRMRAVVLPFPGADQRRIDGRAPAASSSRWRTRASGATMTRAPTTWARQHRSRSSPMATMVGVEATELGEEVGPHQGGAPRGDEDVADGVVLAVVDLVGLHPVHRPTRPCPRSCPRGPGWSGSSQLTTLGETIPALERKASSTISWTVSGNRATSSWQSRK